MYECGVDPECCENTEPVEDTVDDDDASEDDSDRALFLFWLCYNCNENVLLVLFVIS